MVVFPNIKINIGLNIVEKRPDGFHNIESIFYPVPFSDILEIIPSENTQFISSGIEIPGNPEQNLCLKAFQLLKDGFNIPPVKIHLHKTVPIGAGLGGGSSDAAFTLKLLNRIFELKLSEEELERYAQKLGSDCAFFIKNQAKYCYHKGDEFKDIQLELSKYIIAIIYPNIHVSTPEAYAGIVPNKSNFNLLDINALEINEWKNHIKNDFEFSIFKKYPILGEIKDELYQKGALYAAMSGSGSSIFGIFENEVELNSLQEKYLVFISK